MTDNINTEGVVGVGEIVTRVFREAQVEDDYHNAWVAGAVRTCEEAALFVQGELAKAGPYDDTRTHLLLLQWLGDRIRTVQTPTTEGSNAAQT
jgi:hypothetical protein